MQHHTRTLVVIFILAALFALPVSAMACGPKPRPKPTPPPPPTAAVQQIHTTSPQWAECGPGLLKAMGGDIEAYLHSCPPLPAEAGQATPGTGNKLCPNHVNHEGDVIVNRAAHKIYVGCDPDISAIYNGVVVKTERGFPGGWWEFPLPPRGTVVQIAVDFKDGTPVVVKRIRY